MKTVLGPISIDKIILCSADAGPNSQRTEPGQAGYFFPEAPWVGAIRNDAEGLNCKFVILTTGHGLVKSGDQISPYNKHITQYPAEVVANWKSTTPIVLSEDRNSLMLFYAGGCPRDAYLELLNPILGSLGISLLTFGRPNMFDIDHIEECVKMLTTGTSLANIASILGHPDKLEFYFHA